MMGGQHTRGGCKCPLREDFSRVEVSTTFMLSVTDQPVTSFGTLDDYSVLIRVKWGAVFLWGVYFLTPEHHPFSGNY